MIVLRNFSINITSKAVANVLQAATLIVTGGIPSGGFMRFVYVVLSVVIALFPVPALADNYFDQIPTGWRLQNYNASATRLQVSYTASNCAGGVLNFSSSATSDDLNRFWALVLSARALGTRVGIFYETTSGICNITSYFAKEQ